MKKLALILTIISVTTISATSWFGSWFEQEEIIASDEITTQTFELTNVPAKISASSFAQVTIKPLETDKTPYIELRIHTNLLEYATPQENGSTLHLGLHDNRTITVKNIIVMEYTIYMPLKDTIKTLQAYNQSSITIDETLSHKKTVSIESYNQSKVDLSEVTSQSNVTITTYNQSKTTIHKIIGDDVTIKTSNQGKTEIANLTADELTVTATNQSSCIAHIDVNELNVKTSNMAHATITGKAQVQNTSSSNMATNTINVVKK